MEGKVRKGIVIFFISALALMLLSSMAEGADFCVSTAADLQSALTTAASNGQDDVIRIVQGTYTGNFIFNSSEPYALTIEGGYSPGCNTRVLQSANTIIGGNGSDRILTLNFGPSEFTIDGLTLENGKSEGGGGALYANSEKGILILSNNRIINNSVNMLGGSGGGLLASVDELNLIKNVFENNLAANGGAVHIGSPCRKLNFINNYFLSNVATFEGGAILLITRNGQAITFSFIGNSFAKNLSEYGGGVCVDGVFGTISFTNNIFSQNEASAWGGGAHIHAYDTVNLTNNTFVDNSASSGGGITVSVPVFANLYNNLLWKNNGTTGKDLFLRNSGNLYHIPSEWWVLNNIFDESSQGIQIDNPFPIDPSNLDSRLNDPLFIDYFNEDYHLQSTSPCVNAGSNDAPELPTTDKDGLARIVNSSVDMGAYEYQGTIAPVAPDLLAKLKEFRYYKFDERVVVEIEVENRGTNAGPFNVAFYLSQNGVTLGELVNGEFLKQGLRASRNTSVKGHYFSPTPLSGKFIIAVIDSADQVAESVETNNRVVIRIP